MHINYQPNPALTIEDFGEEIIMVNLRNGAYFSLKSTAVIVWRHLISSSGIRELLTTLTGKYSLDEKALADIRYLLSRCVEDELISLPESALSEVSSFALPSQNGTIAFSEPVYEKHTNMQDILLLDPIHDVSNLGWPHRKA